MNYLVLFGLTVAILVIAISIMYFRILFTKTGKFPQTTIGHNKEMAKRKIQCPKNEALKEYKNAHCYSCSKQY